MGTASFTGSHQASPLCTPPIAFGVTDFFAITTWLGCMTTPSPIPFTGTFISHLQAESGKHVVPALAATLELDALLALCAAVASGQISAATAKADYAYYSSLVAGLGGTVLPPC